MGWVDRVPRVGPLFIGGLHAIYQRPDLFKQHSITHILSVIDFDVELGGAFKHLLLRLEDDPNEILLKHFEQTNQFIEDALRSGEGVFVHCAMGKSRSATVICAYLMRRDHLTPQEALVQLCEARPVCCPNPGFMEQLEVYHRMLRAKDEREAQDIYSKWEASRFTGDWWSWHTRKRQSKLT